MDGRSIQRTIDLYRARMHIHDGVLYELCRENPTHETVAVVLAKASLIGRSYQTGIERKIRSTGGQGSSLGQLTDFLYSNRRKIDTQVGKLKGIGATLGRTEAKQIIEVHGNLTMLLSKILRDQQASRSFWSKYLHFHHPAVPIYDSVVAQRIPKVVRWTAVRGRVWSALRLQNHDLIYSRYVTRFLDLYERVRQPPLGIDISVKELDYYLLTS